MTKKKLLLAVIGISLAALVYLSLAGNNQNLPPPLPTLPEGHPAPTDPNSPSGPGQNMTAPDFTLTSLEGKQVTLSKLRGKVVLINFWSSSCMPCLWEMPSFEKLDEAMRGKPFEILAVTTDPRPLAERTISQLGIKVTVLLDPDDEARSAYQVYGIPVTYVIAPDGSVNQQVIGAANWADASAVDYITKLLQAKP